MTARMVARVLAMAVLLIAYLPMFGLLRLFGGGNALVRSYLNWVGWLLGLRIRVDGAPVAGNVLYAANHISWLDIPAVGGTVRARFIAKSEIAGWSVIGWLAKLGGSVFVQRHKRSAARVQGAGTAGTSSTGSAASSHAAWVSGTTTCVSGRSTGESTTAPAAPAASAAATKSLALKRGPRSATNNSPALRVRVSVETPV